jgi:hypothetical protein
VCVHRVKIKIRVRLGFVTMCDNCHKMCWILLAKCENVSHMSHLGLESSGLSGIINSRQPTMTNKTNTGQRGPMTANTGQRRDDEVLCRLGQVFIYFIF